jgi:hypothetical protein
LREKKNGVTGIAVNKSKKFLTYFPKRVKLVDQHCFEPIRIPIWIRISIITMPIHNTGAKYKTDKTSPRLWFKKHKIPNAPIDKGRALP